MSRLNNLYQSAKRPTGKIVAGALIIGALAGMRGCAKNIGEEVYRGNINGQEVVYEENRFSLVSGWYDTDFEKNVMRVKEDGKEYFFQDLGNETSINWRSQTIPQFEGDSLEKVVVKEGDLIRKYSIEDINDSTLDGIHAKEVFERANAIYNQLRTQIREKLRSDYQKKLQSVESVFE